MLAIIIPYYKLTFFEATLESLSNQTEKRFKVYIGDDASPENPAGLLERYKGKFDFVYHCFENNRGGTSLTQQWERCIALSGNEEWIMILGDDDVLGINVVEEFYKQHDFFKGKTNVVRFASVLIDENNNEKSSVFLHPTWENSYDSFYRKITGRTRSSLSEYMFSKDSFLKYGFSDFPLAWHSDDKAWLDFSEDLPIFSINDSIIYLRSSYLNISGRDDNLKQKEGASIAFFDYIFRNKLACFTKEKRVRLIYKYECALRDSKKISMAQWSLILIRYLRNYESYAFKKFMKRSIKSIVNYG